MFPSHHPVKLSSLYDLFRRTESRGKVASRNSLRCRAVRCLCEKRYSTLCHFTQQSLCHLLNCHVLCFRRWRADEARILRVSVNSFLDHLSLVLETMEMFGSPVSQWKDLIQVYWVWKYYSGELLSAKDSLSGTKWRLFGFWLCYIKPLVPETCQLQYIGTENSCQFCIVL